MPDIVILRSVIADSIIQHNLLLCLFLIRGPSSGDVYPPLCFQIHVSTSSFSSAHRTSRMLYMKFGIMIEKSPSNLHSNFGGCPTSTIVPPVGQIWTFVCNDKSAMQHHRNLIPVCFISSATNVVSHHKI